jgi:phenylalanyl-tRNA synthetase beta chain
MKAPVDWIRELVPECKASPDRLAKMLTFSGTEVEGVEKVGKGKVLQCAVTSNRVDCLGVVGIARDVAAVAKKPLVVPDCEVAFAGPPTRDRLRVTVEAQDFCPRYCAFVIEDLKVGPSPDWLRERLEQMGVRPINNVVDVTNYVMFELNQPLHAFDLDHLGGGAIVVRRARAGEKIAALNERTYDLQPWMGVICDAARPVAIAGVMGGLDSAVTGSTSRIVIESAWFEPLSVRRTARALALASDSSHRFERGIDASGAWRAAARAARLIIETAGGRLCADPLDADVTAKVREPIPFRTKRVREVTGANVSARRSEEVLRALGCEVAAGAEGSLIVTPPTFRADLTREIDLVEEVIRIVGLDRVPDGSGLRVRSVRTNPARRLVETLKDRLVALGFLECVTPVFLREGPPAEVAFLDEGKALSVRNPVRQGEGVIRRSLLPSLLEVRKHNQDQGNDGLRLFEVSALAFDRAGALPHQIQAAGLLVDGEFLDLKGVVESLGPRFLAGDGGAAAFAEASSPHLVRGRQLSIVREGRRLGILGVVGPALVEHYALKAAPVFCEIELSALLDSWQPVRQFRGLPRFPAVTRDLAFVVDAGRSWTELEAAIRGAGVAELESVLFFDEYRGAQVGPGKKSLALTVAFRAPDRTLTAGEVDAFVERVVANARERTGAALRS